MTKRPDGRDTIVEPGRTQLGVGSSRTTAPPLVDLVGTIVNGYFLEAELGHGAMGVVYRASHVDTGRVVAIKALHPRHVNEPALVERFTREAKLAARLVHPNIAGVIDSGMSIDDGRMLMVLELAEGEPLSQVLTMPLPPERVIALVAQLLGALDHAHGAGLIHRDLKPENVMVAWREGREHLQIIDFGIAILRDDPAAARLTATGQMIGTPIYMSPEQAKCEAFDHRTDLFALGVIVYEMLSGALPFEGSAMEIALANVNKDPPRIADRVPGLLVEPVLEAFCRKLMARSLDVRFASARAALDTLELIATDPDEAALQLGIMDVARALAVVALSDPSGT